MMARILLAEAAAIAFLFLLVCSSAEAPNSDNFGQRVLSEATGQPDITTLPEPVLYPNDRISKRGQQQTNNSVTDKQQISVVEYLFREDLDSRIDNITDAEYEIATQLGTSTSSFIHDCFTEQVWASYKAVCDDIRRIDWRPVTLEDSNIISCDLTTPTAIALCNRLRAVTKKISDILEAGQQLAVTVGRNMTNSTDNTGKILASGDVDLQLELIDVQSKKSAQDLANLVNPAKAELDALLNDILRLRDVSRGRYSESRKNLEDAWIELAENCTAFVRRALFYAKVIPGSGPSPSDINCPLAKEAMLADISELTLEKGSAQTAYQIHQEALGQWIETAELFDKIGEFVAGIDLVAEASESLLESLSQPTYSEPTAILCALLRLKAGLKQLVSYADRAKVDHGPDNSVSAFSAAVEAFKGFNVTIEDYECST